MKHKSVSCFPDSDSPPSKNESDTARIVPVVISGHEDGFNVGLYLWIRLSKG
jgi:hypothetical protein